MNKGTITAIKKDFCDNKIQIKVNMDLNTTIEVQGKKIDYNFYFFEKDNTYFPTMFEKDSWIPVKGDCDSFLNKKCEFDFEIELPEEVVEKNSKDNNQPPIFIGLAVGKLVSVNSITVLSEEK